MSTESQTSAIILYLRNLSPVYHGKTLELREVIEDWLSFIPNTFPHYTRHTIRHSEEIVRQISKIAFEHDDPSRPVLALTAVEAYVLIAAAFLHDAGMVSSNKEKMEILQTNEWKLWVSDANGGAKRWVEIQELRSGTVPSDSVVRNYLADLETRFLLAEFIRRVHHLRARTVIEQHQTMLARFAFDDPVLQRSIADICVAHGLRTHELEDQERFPDRRDIRGEAANLRLMAILLRLGDLLDMSADRACPLLLNAACPLPADSPAHWTQYQRLTHRLTAPDRIEITAECENQQEHRVLQDWCQWIVDEVSSAKTLLSRSRRHSGYELPFAALEGNDRTIIIRPSSTADYFPSSWTFQLDQEAVFHRLIFDAYEGSDVFIRELIQNALDANRCQMYGDLVRQSIPQPQYPTDVSNEIRSHYPVFVTLKWVEVQNTLSQETEKRQVLRVSDSGIGMDKEVIQRYFLQVGRSFYTTDEFRRKFRFVPTSRFGLGFLSTFAVSDLVTVETFKPSSLSEDGPLRLVLTGPRNYLLTERGSRRRNGTDIEVMLRKPLETEKLGELVEKWCRRVEFPIYVDDLGQKSTVVTETDAQFIFDVQHVGDEQSRFVVRSFPVNRTGIEGELYVFMQVTPEGEAWDRFSWVRYQYPRKHPGAVVPEFPGNLECLHGIALHEEFDNYSGYSARVDYRGEQPFVTLTRAGWNRTDPVIRSRWEEIITEHVSTSPFSISEGGWKYRQRLVDIFPLESLWRSMEKMIPLYIDSKQVLTSLDGVQKFPTITIVVSEKRVHTKYLRFEDVKTIPPLDKCQTPVLIHDYLLSTSHRKSIIGSRIPVRLYWLNQDYVATEWLLVDHELSPFAETTLTKFFLLEMPITKSLGCGIRWPESRESVFLNATHPFVKWLGRVKTASKEGDQGIMPSQFKILFELMDNPFRYAPQTNLRSLQEYLRAWSNLPSLTPDLYPPVVDLTDEMFRLPYWDSRD